VVLRARDGIVPVPSERSAAGQPDQTEPYPTTDAVKRYRFRHVVRAGRLESTGPGKQRRNKYFIASYEAENDSGGERASRRLAALDGVGQGRVHSRSRDWQKTRQAFPGAGR
jgi:hypothetical protein